MNDLFVTIKHYP